MSKDTIYRQDAIDALIRKMRPQDNGDGTMVVYIMSGRLVEETLNDLPSAQPDVPNTNVGDMVSRAAAIDILDAYQVMVENGEENPYAWARLRMSELPSAQPEQQNGRIFQGIVVEYLSYNTYPEYKGKPYFSIKYTENGQKFIGYGTYKPEVLSEYLKEYFMPSVQSERESIKWIPHESIFGGSDERVYTCDKCGYNIGFHVENFCPNCGGKYER